MIEFALGAYLGTRSAVTALVGTNVYGDKAPQKDKNQATPDKYICYSQVGGDKFHHSRGASGLADAAIQITCKSTSYVKARELYEVLRNQLDGFSGMWGTTVVRSAFLSEPTNISTPAAQLGNDAGQNAVQGMLSVKYFRAVPTL